MEKSSLLIEYLEKVIEKTKDKKHSFLKNSLDFDQDILEASLKTMEKNEDYFKIKEKLEHKEVENLDS